MNEEFIKNEQINYIKQQMGLIKDSAKKNLPPAVMMAVIDLANAKILDLFPNTSSKQQALLDLSSLKTDDEYKQYIERLTEYLIPFPKVTEQQLKKLFPKNKKLKLPDLTSIDYSQLTYLSWNDLGSNKKYIVYELEGRISGIECRLTPTGKKNICSFCNSHSEVAYFSTVTKAKKPKNPDYYRAIGNLICTDSHECNKKITNVDYLTEFLKDSLAR
ncbi:FusB/FusC family EF-G-binding protein [Bacillus tuaregi]|uniref:FusB/FusC family EF-G-binding protein n=1 Tax=Bacillus tuaregi TaxID=1816695 RepID=UPI0008F85C7A|nr:FusB/FusC family EF-G-binding protein [Bacillus tuaregi]